MGSEMCIRDRGRTISLKPTAANNSITSSSGIIHPGYPLFLTKWIILIPLTSIKSKPKPTIRFKRRIALLFIPKIESSSIKICFAPILFFKIVNFNHY